MSFLFFFYNKEEVPTLKEADKAYIERNYSKSISIYEMHRKSLQKNQLVNLGDAYFKVGQPEKALAMYESMENNNELSKEYLGEFYLRMAKWEDEDKNKEVVISFYKKAIKNAQSLPLKLRAKKEYAYFISESPSEGEVEIALTYLTELSKQPTEQFNYDIYYRLGNLSYLAAKYEDALFYWDKTLALNHQFVPAYEKIGILYLDTKNYKKSLDTFKKALTYEPNNWRSYFGIAESYVHLGNTSLAIDNYKQTLSFNQNHLPSHYQIAEIYIKKGEKSAAVEHYYLIYQKDPNSKLGKLAKEALEKYAPSAKTDPY